MFGHRLVANSGSLLWRTSAIVLVASLVISVTAILSINAFVLAPLWERSAADKAGLLSLTANTWVELPENRRPSFELEIFEKHGWILSEHRENEDVSRQTHRYYQLIELELEKLVGESVEINRDPEAMLRVDVPTASGTTLRVQFSPHLPHLQGIYVGLSLLGVVIVIVLVTSFSIALRISKPLTRIAQAVATFRGVGGFRPLPEKGADEYVTLARNFNKMAQEIETLVSSRTTLTAGISHDLRTPLTRMTLALELLPESVDSKLVDRFRQNIAEMDELISDASIFATGESEKETKWEIANFTLNAVSSVDEEIPVTWKGKASTRCFIAAGALKRCIANLLLNAKRHAKGVKLHVVIEQNLLVFHVLDDGPGIPEKDRVRVLQPFVRLEESRNRATGGSGLGLAIVSQLCDIHGWTIEIGSSETGGTDAILSIPLQTSAKSYVDIDEKYTVASR